LWEIIKHLFPDSWKKERSWNLFQALFSDPIIPGLSRCLQPIQEVIENQYQATIAPGLCCADYNYFLAVSKATGYNPEAFAHLQIPGFPEAATPYASS
jgi:hypothetical protein